MDKNSLIQLLEILVCPVTHQRLTLMEPVQLAELNAAIERGEVRRVNGETVSEPIEVGLVREDGAVTYEVRTGIPLMLAEVGIDWKRMSH